MTMRASVDSDTEHAPALRKRRILVAEDDASLRRLIAISLIRDGYEVAEAADGSELLDLLGSALVKGGTATSFDLVVSDIRMPGWTGLDLVAGLHRWPWGPPILLMTAFGSAEVHSQAQRLGAVAVLDKPFDLDDFRTVVANLLRDPVVGTEKDQR